MRFRYVTCAVLLATAVITLFLALTRETDKALAFVCNHLNADCSALSGHSLWIALAVTFSSLAGMWMIWRCPACNGFLGTIEAKVCRHCQTSLYGSSTSEYSAAYADKHRIEDNRRRQGKIMQYLETLQRYSRMIWISFAGTALLMALARVMGMIETKWWSLVGIGVIGYLSLQLVMSTIHNILALSFKCPACEKSLAGQSGPHCPFCGYEMEESVEVDTY